MDDSEINRDGYDADLHHTMLAVVEELPPDHPRRKAYEALTNARPRPWDNTSPWPPAGTH